MIGSVSLLPFLLMKHSWALASTITTLALEALSTAVAHTFSLVRRLQYRALRQDQALHPRQRVALTTVASRL